MVTEKTGLELLSRFKIDGWPVALFLDPSGEEVDLVGGYTPPAEKHHQKILNALKGVDAFRSLAEQYAKGSRDVLKMIALARKYYWKTDGQEKMQSLLKEVIALDPEGRGGTVEYDGKTISCAEYAEFILAREATQKGLGSGKYDPDLFRAFLRKYPSTLMIKEVINGLLPYYYSHPDRNETIKFYEGLMAKFPDDPMMINSYVRWIIKDKQDLDLGIKLSEKILSLTSIENTYYAQNLAELYLLKGDNAAAERSFGRKFMTDKIMSLGYALINFSRFWSSKSANLDTAVSMTETALKLNPDNPYFLQSAADLYFKVNKPDKAHEIYGTGYVGKINDNAGLLTSYASYWNDRKENMDSALAAALKSVDLLPRDYSWDVLAQVYVNLGKYEEALKAEEKAVAAAAAPNPRYEARIKKIKEALVKK